MRFLAASIVLALGSSIAHAQDAVEVTGSVVNVRTGPGTGNRELGEVRRGQVYAVLGRQGEWYRLQFGNGAGWSHGNLLRASNARVLEVVGTHVNVRSGAGARFRDLGDLSMGARVAVRSSSGEWRRIHHAGRDAWVHGRFLAPVGSGRASSARPTSAVGFIQLPASGPGFFSYAVPGRRWGTPTMVYGLERVGARWKRQHPDAPPIAVGDISLMNGGNITGHVSHERGVDVDVRPMPKGPNPIAVTRFSSRYSQLRTASLIRMFRQELPTTLTLFNDRSISGTTRWPNHDNHFHVRIRR